MIYGYCIVNILSKLIESALLRHVINPINSKLNKKDFKTVKKRDVK